MGLSDLIARTKSNFTNDASPIQWSPSTHSVPAGWKSVQDQLRLDQVASHSTIKFSSRGLWATGTVVFCYQDEDEDNGQAYGRATAEGDAPPQYERGGHSGSGNGKGDRGVVLVTVESRFNDESLSQDAKATTFSQQEEYTCGLDLATSNAKPRASSLSFYITFTIPRSITSLNGLVVDSSQFRVILDPSMTALSIATIKLSTSDAPVMLPALTGVGSLTVNNLNRLDPSRRAMQCHDDLITTLPSMASSGQSIRSVRSVSSSSRGSSSRSSSGAGSDPSDRVVARAETITLNCANGAISGRWETTRGHLSVATTNFPVTGHYHAEGALRVMTTNDMISGSFVSRSTRLGGGGILIDAQQGRVEGTFESRGPVKVHAINAPITGSFVVGSELAIKTTHFKIDASVEIMPALSASASSGPSGYTGGLNIPGSNGANPDLLSSSGGGASGGRDDLSYTLPPTERRPSIDPPPSLHPGAGTSPTQSVLSFVSSTGTVTQPPTFEQALRNGARPEPRQHGAGPTSLASGSTYLQTPGQAGGVGVSGGTDSTSASLSPGPYGSTVTVSAETNEGQVTLEFANQPRDVTVISSAQSSGGAKVSIRHPSDWTGQFQVSTTIYSVASVHVADVDQVRYTTKKRHELVGTIGGLPDDSSSVHHEGQEEEEEDHNNRSNSMGNGHVGASASTKTKNKATVLARGPAEILFV